MMDPGWYVYIAILIIAFFFTFKYRQGLAGFFEKIPLPKSLLFLVSGIPFIIIEESINCIGCLPYSIAWLFAYAVILLGIIKVFRLKSFWFISMLYAVLGTIVEVYLGPSKALFPTLEPGLLLFMLLWTGFSYIYLIIVPLTILLDE